VRCTTADDAVEAFAAQGRRPVVVKVDSAAFPHKSDHGLVLTGLTDDDAVHAAATTVLERARRAEPTATIDGVLVCEQVSGGVEAVVGVATDDLFGPTVMVGLGGTLVELYRDVAFRVPPFDRDEARRMVLGLRAAPLLHGFRGRPPADVEALLDVVMAVQQLAVDLDGVVVEIDLNPVLVLPDRAVVLDALVVAAPPD
jgi:acyl-CoA synthetase (NDP forming)